MPADQDHSDPGEPIYPTGPSTIPVDSIFRFVNLLKKHGRISEFRKAAKASGAFVTADPQTVRFVKDFVAAHDALREDSLGAQVLRPTRAAAKKPPAKGSGDHECVFS